MRLTAREQIADRARLNNWNVSDHGPGSITVSKLGHWITVRFGRRGEITRVSSNTAQFRSGDKLGQVLRLMGTLTIE